MGESEKQNRKEKKQILSRPSHDEENGCRFEGQRVETLIHSRLAWIIAIWERMLEFYSD